MRVYLGSDHAGFERKETVREHLQAEGYDVTDVGTSSEESVDYPDFAAKVARAVARGDADMGVLVCGTGIGMAIAANKVHGVRAANVTIPEFARLARQHNDANVVTVPGRFLEEATVYEIIDTFLTTPFEGGRHERRVAKMDALDAPAPRKHL
jgi:ribose 5-phosphate isomerase B